MLRITRIRRKVTPSLRI